MKKMEGGSSLGGGNNESQWAAVWEEGESSKRLRRGEPDWAFHLGRN
jgi:hypothetical protein